MSANSKINWTQDSWNPCRGCTKVSPGCAHCYAEKFAERFRGVPGSPYEQGFDPRIVPEQLDFPFVVKGGERRRVFVNSMSDLFHEAIDDDFIHRVFEVMRLCNWKVFQVLSKRPERMASLMAGRLQPYADLQHIWLGTSVEDRRHGVPRIDTLRAISARVRWISAEPLLEDLGTLDLTGIHLVVAGGESGNHLYNARVRAQRGLVVTDGKHWLPRPDRIDWIRSMRDQCNTAGVPFWFKQFGGPSPDSAGALLDGRLCQELPPHGWAPVPDKDERWLRREWVREYLIGPDPKNFLPTLPTKLLAVTGGVR